jgi:hypothetical protein
MKTEAGNCRGRLKRVTNNSKENAQIIKLVYCYPKASAKQKNLYHHFSPT